MFCLFIDGVEDVLSVDRGFLVGDYEFFDMNFFDVDVGYL